MPRRTFYNYRQAVEELFNIEIKCDSATFDYYISDIGDRHNEGVTNWLLNTAVTNELLAGSRAVADKIFLEQVPSAREFLAPVIESLLFSLLQYAKRFILFTDVTRSVRRTVYKKN